MSTIRLSLARLICRCFGHAFSGWRYLSEADCQQQDCCRRCGEYRERVFHAWGPWTKAPTQDRPCLHIRVCTRDRATQETEKHEWKKTHSELIYRNAGKGGGPDITEGYCHTYVCTVCGCEAEDTTLNKNQASPSLDAQVTSAPNKASEVTAPRVAEPQR